MRYLGNKTRILDQIDEIITEKNLQGGIFADLFTGSGSVADHFKDRFQIISNDLMNYAKIFSLAKTSFSKEPEFSSFRKIIHMSPFEYWNNYDYSNEPTGFISENFTPKGNRKFFQEKNAIKIDTIRRQLDDFKTNNIITEKEFTYLLASLLESTMGVSNTSGTYEAFFKDWESRSTKDLHIKPLSMETKKLFSHNNQAYQEDANQLVRKISGDIAYIDTPYTITQYASAYHVLETIALNDQPEIAGKTGRRVKRTMSDYSKKNGAKIVFEDLLRQLNFKHVIISYSNQSLIPLPEFIEMIRKFAINHEIEAKTINFREYKNLNASQKGHGKQLQEVLIYFKKDITTIKSPLNYAGSKDSLMDKITPELPKHITNIVDIMGGAFNVGNNIVAMEKTYYNDNNPFVYEIVRNLLSENKNEIVAHVQSIIKKYKLSPKNKETYLQLRKHYNSQTTDKRDSWELFVLTLFSFQHMIRYNSHGEYNVPIGNSGLTNDVIKRILNYRSKTPIGSINLGSFLDIDIHTFDKDTLFYFDPPYIITSAAYNDGKRYKAQWGINEELKLLTMLESINANKQKFLLSNVLEHQGQKNDLLIDWVKKNQYNMIIIGRSGRRYPRSEVLIKNY